MTKMEFLVNLNNLTITDTYDDAYFNVVFSTLLDFLEADRVLFTYYSTLNVKENDMVFEPSKDVKIVFENCKKNLEDKESFILFVNSILSNMYKNKIIVESLSKEVDLDSQLGVLNRSAYEKLIRTKRALSNVTVAFVDINGLGVENNRYGHEAGDAMLLTVAGCFKANFRASDIYRIGGDELLIISENLDVEKFKEKFKVSLDSLGKTSYSVSYGIEHEETCSNLKELVRRSNELMKYQKEEFRRNNPKKYENKYDVEYLGSKSL